MPNDTVETPAYKNLAFVVLDPTQTRAFIRRRTLPHSDDPAHQALSPRVRSCEHVLARVCSWRALTYCPGQHRGGPRVRHQTNFPCLESAAASGCIVGCRYPCRCPCCAIADNVEGKLFTFTITIVNNYDEGTQ